MLIPSGIIDMGGLCFKLVKRSKIENKISELKQ